MPSDQYGQEQSHVCCLGIQSVEQLKDNYEAEKAAVITSIGGNLICGQQTGDASKKLSETFGKIMQEREGQLPSKIHIGILSAAVHSAAIQIMIRTTKILEAI